MIVSLEQVNKSFGVEVVLQDITAKIEDNDFVGLIGVNGAGKSTLLNLLNGDLEADNGILSRGSGKQFGFLRQNSGLQGGNSIWEEMQSVFATLHAMEKEMRELEHQIASLNPTGVEYQEKSLRYAAIQGQFEAKDGYLIDVKISSVLNGMGFGDTDLSTGVDVLSGGEKTRLALCKLLLEHPDLLILDEPTNHLDFKTLVWLEDYLKLYKGAVLVVSHDRYFLDKLCNHIWELQNHRLTTYRGNYSQYLTLKEQKEHQQQKDYDEQQQEIAEAKDFIARNIVRASTTARAQSRQKALDRMEKIQAPKPPPKPPKIRFQYVREPVKDVLHVTQLQVSVGEGAESRTLVDSLDFDFMRGEKIALIGHNGIGKSTFLKILMGILPKEKGEIEWGRNTDLSYFDQGEGGLCLEKTAIQQLWDEFPRENEHVIRSVLGQAGLRGEDVYKKVGTLSGGERARLKFARFMMLCGNVLIMDEPTNHLDLPTKEVLDEAISSYTGSLLVVSHDRYLLNKFPDKIVEMTPQGMKIYLGRYEDYLLQKEKENLTSSAPVVVKKEEKSENSQANSGYRSKKQRSEDAAFRKRLTELERQVEELETEIWRLENEISDPEIAADYMELQQRCNLLEEKKTDLDCAMNEWGNLQESREL